MYSGYAQFGRYGFLSAGFWVVLVCGLALCLVYAVGANKGRRAARLWVNACMAALAIGAIADIAWAVVSGQWRSFMIQFGFSPLAEMMLLAALFIGSMWWMAVRYVDGLKE